MQGIRVHGNREESISQDHDTSRSNVLPSILPGNVQRLLIVKHAPHPKRGESLGHYFVRLNANFIENIVILEMPEDGGSLVCIHGNFTTEKARAEQSG